MKKDTTNTRYQDQWVKGETIVYGERHCESRYSILQQFMRRYENPISMLDFGANHGYFSFRSAWDHPCWDITMVDSSERLLHLTVMNGMSNISLLNEYIEADEIESLGKFDLTLAMSVLHHFEEPTKVIDTFLEISNDVIFEISYPREKTYANQHLVPIIYEYITKLNPTQLNAHIKHDRPIYYISKDDYAFKGKVHCGCGKNGSIVYPEIKEELFELFNCHFYPGSLNIEIQNEKLSFKNPILVDGEIRLYPMYIHGLPVLMMRGPEIEYPTSEIEVISPYRLRDFLNLRVFDIVDLSMNKKYLED